MVTTMNVSTDGWSSLQGLLTKYHFLYIYNSGAEHDGETWQGNYLVRSMIHAFTDLAPPV